MLFDIAIVALLLLLILVTIGLIRRNRRKQAEVVWEPGFIRDWDAAQREALQMQQSGQLEQSGQPIQLFSPAQPYVPANEAMIQQGMPQAKIETPVQSLTPAQAFAQNQALYANQPTFVDNSAYPSTPHFTNQPPLADKPMLADNSGLNPPPLSPMQQHPAIQGSGPYFIPEPIRYEMEDETTEPVQLNQGSMQPVQMPIGERASQQIGNYRIVRLVGQGGFADVYLAEHIYLKRQAAIKFLQIRMVGSDIQNFRKEAQIVADLKHPHIVSVMDFGLEDTTPYIIMEYGVNGTLRELHPKKSRMPITTVLPYAKQVASALQYAHNQKLIHRDIKPENMLLDSNKNILLSDFGLATVATTATAQHTNHVAGTALYMAPEQFKGEVRIASDQYALAVVVYEWLCGSPPFSEGNFIQLGFQHSYVPLPSLSEKVPFIAPAIEQVLAKALSKDAAQRYESVTAFVNALEQAANTR